MDNQKFYGVVSAVARIIERAEAAQNAEIQTQPATEATGEDVEINGYQS